MSVIDTLIFDRTQNDVENKTKKGHYNSDDLNRVINAVNYLADIFYQFGYSPGVTPQTTDWTADKIPEDAQMRVYLGNVRLLMDTLEQVQFSAELPQSMALLSYAGANSIEQILVELDAYLTAMDGVFIRAGMPWAYAGNEVYVAND